MAIKNSQEREEVMKARTYTRWTKRVALGLAVAAIAAPSAQAYYFGELGTAGNVPSNVPAWQTIVPSKAFPTDEQIQQFRGKPGELTHPFSFTPSNEPVGPTVVIPDPTRGLPTVDELQQFRFTPDPIVTPVADAPSGGIDWTDAGIGAGMALGAILLGAAAALGLRRRGLAHS
jgi:hypothetical protein